MYLDAAGFHQPPAHTPTQSSFWQTLVPCTSLHAPLGLQMRITICRTKKNCAIFLKVVGGFIFQPSQCEHVHQQCCDSHHCAEYPKLREIHKACSAHSHSRCKPSSADTELSPTTPLDFRQSFLEDILMQVVRLWAPLVHQQWALLSPHIHPKLRPLTTILRALQLRNY